jgi:hypothetical protein
MSDVSKDLVAASSKMIILSILSQQECYQDIIKLTFKVMLK